MEELLNCCTWTVSEDMSKTHHSNTENDNRYKSIIEKYQNDSNSVCFDEIQFWEIIIQEK